VTQAADDLELVGLEGHARTATVAEAAARQGRLDLLAGHLHTGGQPLEDGDKSGAMGLTSGQPTKHADDSPMRLRSARHASGRPAQGRPQP
jgi:hypothetical protein